MSQSEKAAYFRALKQAGVKFDRHYREYSTEELKAGYEALQKELGAEAPPVEVVEAAPPPTRSRDLGMTIPVKAKDVNEMAGQRLNTNTDMQPIRRDPETGFIWYQEEVLKPAFPKPRGRRILRTQNAPTEQVTVNDGQYTETFEVSGQGPKQATEIKITLPSYQVGIYKDDRFPFLIVVYNGKQGFRREDVEAFYNGRDLVPGEIKRVYVSNVLCYDMRTTIRAIQTEYRRLQLAGKA